MAEENKDSKSKVIIIVLIVLLVLMLTGGTVMFIILTSAPDTSEIAESIVTTEQSNPKNPLILDYDTGAVAIDEDSLQKAVDEMYEKTQNGYMTLDFQNSAISDDGINFVCHIGNDPKNTADMFVNIYKDNTLSEQLYLSGLIPPGKGLESFTSEQKLETGTYDAVLVFTQVEDDHETLKAQVSVALTLVVS